MDKQQEFALRTVEERDVRFIRLWFTDVLGTLKSVAIAPAELEAAFEEGLGFDGSAIEGMTRVSFGVDVPRVLVLPSTLTRLYLEPELSDEKKDVSGYRRSLPQGVDHKATPMSARATSASRTSVQPRGRGRKVAATASAPMRRDPHARREKKAGATRARPASTSSASP